MIGSDRASVPAQGQTLKDLGGRLVSELISADTRISAGGAVTGTLKYITGVTAFGDEATEGNFFPLVLNDKYKNKTKTVKRDGAARNTSTDQEWVMYVPAKETKFTFETDEDGEFLSLSFESATLEGRGK